MPRTKGNKNRPKTNNDYATQIAEKQEAIESLNTEIAFITANIDTLKATIQFVTKIKRRTKLKEMEREKK